MRMEFLWLALIVVFAVIEGATTALTTVWFIGGALAAGQPFPPAERLVSLGWLFALTLAAQAILFPYLFRHGVEKARLYMMIFFVVLLALVAALAGLAGAALPQGSILFLLGAPAALVLALLLCLASVPLSVRQYVKRLG